MSKNPVESPPLSNSEPDEALRLVLRLARTRGNIHDDAIAGISETAGPADQVEAGMREIELASAALRRAQPDLDDWGSMPVDSAPARKPGSAWVVVGVVWLSTVLALSLATVAIAVLVS